MQLLSFILWAPCALAKEHRLSWDITESKISPDKVPIKSILINRRFPGPSIKAYVGDRINVLVRNNLPRGFTIHWHGIKQTGSVEMDGVPHITQLPISSGTSYTYNFTADAAGTFWFHAHTGLDSEQAFGALIVKDKLKTRMSIARSNSKYEYHGERTLLLTEWWHETPEEARRKIITLPFSGIDGSQSHLINGQCLDSKEGPYILNVKPGKKYRLRLIGATGLSMLRFKIIGHKFTVIEVDGTIVEPVEVDHIDINSGERYSVILHANQPIKNYFGSISTPFEYMEANNGGFILKYNGARNTTKPKRGSNNYSQNRFIESRLNPSKWYNNHKSRHYYKPPQRIDKEIFLSTHLAAMNGLPVHTMNEMMPTNRSGVLWNTIRNGSFKPNNLSCNVNQGDNVQIVIEDLIHNGGRRCRVHPWHLHGHSFHVVAHGQGFYNPKTDRRKIDEYLRKHPNPILRDTFTLYTSEQTIESTFEGKETYVDLGIQSSTTNKGKKEFRSCGWYAIRFKANNPGSWMLHCHITHHVLMGMTTVINVHPKERPFIDAMNSISLTYIKPTAAM